mmetsp:Transcript_50451/g.57133  ORF Transcript_50451/g.57133 Transcript_50451/m.57133 type:complete len:220 (-) Transcript_50451:112-771(-)
MASTDPAKEEQELFNVFVSSDNVDMEDVVDVELHAEESHHSRTKQDPPITKENEDADFDDLLDNDLPQEPSLDDRDDEQHEAAHKLRQSTTRFASALKTASEDLDTKYGISASAKGIDQTFGVSHTAHVVGNCFSKWSSKAREKAKALVPTGTVDESVQQVSTSLTETLEKTGVTEVWNKETTRVHQFDKEHRITTQTMEAVATGFDWVASTIPSSKSE